MTRKCAGARGDKGIGYLIIRARKYRDLFGVYHDEIIRVAAAAPHSPACCGAGACDDDAVRRLRRAGYVRMSVQHHFDTPRSKKFQRAFGVPETGGTPPAFPSKLVMAGDDSHRIARGACELRVNPSALRACPETAGHYRMVVIQAENDQALYAQGGINRSMNARLVTRVRMRQPLNPIARSKNRLIVIAGDCKQRLGDPCEKIAGLVELVFARAHCEVAGDDDRVRIQGRNIAQDDFIEMGVVLRTEMQIGKMD